MSGGDEERPRRSWREIDRMRDRGGRREERPPRSARAEAAARQATKQYLKKLDGLFAAPAAARKSHALATAVREAHGTSGLAAACRAYLDGLGPPEDPALLAMFLDAGDRALSLAALEGLRTQRDAGRLDLGAGLRAQLRLLAEDPDDELASAAEALLAGS